MVPHRRGRGAGGRAAGHRAGRRHARHAVPRPSPPPGLERPAAARARRCGLRLEGRPGACGDPQRDRQPGGGGAALSDRRHLLRHPPRALSGRHRDRASGPRGEFSCVAGAHRDHQAVPGARRRQPEEHPRRAARAGVSRRRVRVVRRSGLRPRLLPHPPATQVPVGAAGKKRVPELFCRSAGRLSRAHVVRGSRVSRGAHRGLAAGAAARSGGRQVSGGISHRRQGPGPQGGAGDARGAAGHSGRNSESMARIIEVRGRRVWDSRGRPTVEAEVIVGRGTTPLASGRAIAPAGARLAKKGALQGVADEGGYWPAFKSNEEALAELVGAIADAGLEPGVDVSIALDMAATQLYRGGSYQFALDGRALSAEQLHAMLLRWIDSYPIVSIEDPFAEHDGEAMRAFTEAAPIQVVGDDFFVTHVEKLRNAKGPGNAILLKPNQVGTLTETLACWDAARAMGYGAIVSARSGETEDVSIVHLAVGWGVPQLKVGGFSRSERMAKWNEGLRIEEALGGKALPYPARKLFRR